jgi:hypothetical protein
MRHWGLVGYVVLCVFLCVALVQVQVEVQRNKETHLALCALRADLQNRVRSSEEFLRDHPEGFAGITAEQIQVQVINQKRTIDAIGFLDC